MDACGEMQKLAAFVLHLYTQSTFKVRIHTMFYHVSSRSPSSVFILECCGVPQHSGQGWNVTFMRCQANGARLPGPSTSCEDVDVVLQWCLGCVT